MAMNRYASNYNDYAPAKPTRPRRRKLKKYTSVSHAKSVRGKNVAALNKVAQEVSEKHNIDLSKISIRGSWYGSPELHWTLPESDADFESRKAAEEREYARYLKIYETEKANYDKFVEQQSVKKIGKAVSDHEAAINTIAEVLKKYPDVLDRAVAKAVKGK